MAVDYERPMKIAIAAIVALSAAGAARGELAEAPVRVAVGRVTATVPAGAEYERSDVRGVASLTVLPAPGAEFDLLSYDWWGNLVGGGPTDARAFLASLHETEGLQDFEIIAPTAESSFKGLPAWSLTRRFRMGNPSRGVPDKVVQESYLLVQRRWGFLVLEYDQSPALFAADQPKFQEFVDRLELASEPPLGPLPVISIVLLLGAGALIWALRRRQGNSPRSA